MSKLEAKAALAGGAVLSTLAFTLALGPIGASILASVYAYLGVIGAANLDKCPNNVELSLSYVGYQQGWKCV